MKKSFKLIGKAVLLLTGLLWIPMASVAQTDDLPGWAGPDKHTCKKKNAMFETIPVEIGGHAVTGYCYYWTPADGLSDVHSSHPMAAPDDTKTYTLTVVADNFAFEMTDQVTVFVNEINSVTATPKRCCYKAKDTLKTSMFTITTDPPGLDQYVVFDPPLVPFQSASQYNATITIKTSCFEWSTPVQTQVSIVVINPDHVITTGVGWPMKFADKVGEAADKIEKALKKIEENSGKFPGPGCKPSAGTSMEINFSQGLMCCPGKPDCIQDAFATTVNWKPSFEVKCDVPFYGIPYLAQLNARIKVNAAINVSGKLQDKCDGNELCLGFAPELTLFGGASLTILGGGAIDADLGFAPKVTILPVKLCLWPKVELSGASEICGQLDVVGTITLLGAAKYKLQYPLIDKTCYKLF